jgi:lysyl-tRNA synthetase class 2
MKKDSEEPYPHKFNVTISLEEFIENFSSLSETQILHDEQYSVAGMLNSSFFIKDFYYTIYV